MTAQVGRNGSARKAGVSPPWLPRVRVAVPPRWLLTALRLRAVRGNELPAFATAIRIHESNYFSFCLFLELLSVRWFKEVHSRPVKCIINFYLENTKVGANQIK